MMARYEKYLIRRAALGLFHGMDCYRAYEQFCKNPHIVHDVHLREADRISDLELEFKLSWKGALRLIYVGRVHREKGVFDWVQSALAVATKMGVNFTASWYGNGPEF